MARDVEVKFFQPFDAILLEEIIHLYAPCVRPLRSLRFFHRDTAHVAIRQNVESVLRQNHDGPCTQRTDVIKPKNLDTSAIVHPDRERNKGLLLDQSL
jgi:hypothetical protein